MLLLTSPGLFGFLGCWDKPCYKFWHSERVLVSLLVLWPGSQCLITSTRLAWCDFSAVNASLWKAVMAKSREWLGLGFFFLFLFLETFLSPRDTVCLKDTWYFGGSACSHTVYKLNPSKTEKSVHQGPSLPKGFVPLSLWAGFERGSSGLGKRLNRYLVDWNCAMLTYVMVQLHSEMGRFTNIIQQLQLDFIFL